MKHLLEIKERLKSATKGMKTEHDEAYIKANPTDIAKLIQALEMAIDQRDAWIKEVLRNDSYDNYDPLETHQSHDNSIIESILAGDK